MVIGYETWAELTEVNHAGTVTALAATDTMEGTLLQNMAAMGGVIFKR